MSGYYVYILTNERNKIFYTGLTDNLLRRIYEHKIGAYPGFTKRYGTNKLVYFEKHMNYETAATKEKLMKRWKRSYKINVIETMNPYWDDLYLSLAGDQTPQQVRG